MDYKDRNWFKMDRIWIFRKLADAKCGILKNKTDFFEQNTFLNQFESMTILRIAS